MYRLMNLGFSFDNEYENNKSLHAQHGIICPSSFWKGKVGGKPLATSIRLHRQGRQELDPYGDCYVRNLTVIQPFFDSAPHLQPLSLRDFNAKTRSLPETPDLDMKRIVSAVRFGSKSESIDVSQPLMIELF